MKGEIYSACPLPIVSAYYLSFGTSSYMSSTLLLLKISKPVVDGFSEYN